MSVAAADEVAASARHQPVIALAPKEGVVTPPTLQTVMPCPAVQDFCPGGADDEVVSGRGFRRLDGREPEVDAIDVLPRDDLHPHCRERRLLDDRLCQGEHVDAAEGQAGVGHRVRLVVSVSNHDAGVLDQMADLAHREPAAELFLGELLCQRDHPGDMGRCHAGA